MTQPKIDKSNDQPDESMPDRRAAMKAMGRYAAYTAPSMAVLLNIDEAHAGWRRRWRRHRWRRHRRGRRGGPPNGS